MAKKSTDAGDVVLKKPSDIEGTSRGIVKRWLAELALASEDEEDWRKEAHDILDLYDSNKSKANSFNILWSNTETLRPAVYNSTPQPDVRRRFRDADPVGKVASTVLERALSYQIDDYDFDAEIRDSVLDLLLPGRGVARIVYEPHFVSVTRDGMQPAPRAGAYQEPPQPQPELKVGEPQQAADPSQYEKLAGQEARCEHVQWNDFRRGPGKRWKDCPWVSFRHEFTQEMAEEKFGSDIAKAMTYSQGTGSDKLADKDTKEIFKVCEAWEIWDKDQRRVLFIAPTYNEQPLAIIPDPLRLRGFFPLPRPIYAIENSRSLVPTPLYRLYKEQAMELDRVSARINKIVGAMKVRGAYSAHIKEAANVLDAGDNEMVPIENPALIAEHGGLEKLIWILPLNTLVQVLNHLYQARDKIKQAIYEITGIADVIRGATNPNETLGAQKLKSQWGSLRIQKLQREIQRFVRDLMRLKAEIFAEHFTAEQLQAMTGIALPDQEAKQRAQATIMQAKQQGQPPPKEALAIVAKPSWDEVMQLLRSDQMRQYRVDIETDSTVADTINQDMRGFSEGVDAIGRVIAGSQQAVMSGMLPIDAVKEIALAFSRRARMGSSLEDALEKIQPPAPPQQEQAPPDNSLQVAQIEAQTKQAIAQAQEQGKLQIAQMREQAETQRQQMADQMQAMSDRQKQELDAAVRVIVAQISASKATQVDPGTAANANREFAQGVVQ